MAAKRTARAAGGAHIVAQGLGASGQDGGVHATLCPAARGFGAQAGFQIFAQGGGQRLLITCVRCDIVQRPVAGFAGRQQALQARLFTLQGDHVAARIAGCVPRFACAVAQISEGGFSCGEGVAGGFQCRGPLADIRFQSAQIRAVLRPGALQRGAGGLRFALQPVSALAGLFGVAPRALQAGAEIGAGGAGGVQIGFGLLACRISVGERGFGARLGRGVGAGLFAQPVHLTFQPGQRGARLFVQFRFAGLGGLQLGEARFEPRDGVSGRVDIAVECVAGAFGQAQRGGGFGLALAQRLDARGGVFRFRCGGRGGAQGRVGLGAGGLQRGFGHSYGVARLAPPAQPKQAFILADGLGQLAIAPGLTRLALQAGVAGRQIVHDFLQPGEIGLGGGEAQLGFAPARAQTRHAGGFFQDPAAVFPAWR